MDRRPHIIKTRAFLQKYPGKLESNEWLVKWPMVFEGKKTTYNPDFYDPKTKEFIELCTSKGNLAAQGHKWNRAIEVGYPLRVFWWEGMEMTDFLKRDWRSYQIDFRL